MYKTKGIYKPAISAVMVIVLMISSFLTQTLPIYAAVKRPSKVTGVKVQVSGQKINLSWNKAKNAKKYRIYVKYNSNSWKTYKKAISKRKITYSLNKTGTYSFRIKAINSKGKLSKYYSRIVKAKKRENKPINIEECETFYAKEGSTIVTWIKQQITINIRGAGSTKATWKFDSDYLNANKNAGREKTFKTLKIGETTVTVTSSDKKHKIKIKVIIDKTGCDEDQDDIYEKLKKDSSGYFNTPEQMYAVPLENVLDTTEAEEADYELAMRYKEIAETVTKDCETPLQKLEAISKWKKNYGFTFSNKGFNKTESILDSKCGTTYGLSQMTALLFRYAGVPAAYCVSPKIRNTLVLLKTNDKWTAWEVALNSSINGVNPVGYAEDVMLMGYCVYFQYGFYATTSLKAV